MASTDFFLQARKSINRVSMLRASQSLHDASFPVWVMHAYNVLDKICMEGQLVRTGMGRNRLTAAQFRRCKTNFENMRAHGGEQVTGIYAASWGGGGASMALNEAMIAAGMHQLMQAPCMTLHSLFALCQLVHTCM